jgi:hypothetical protein
MVFRPLYADGKKAGIQVRGADRERQVQRNKIFPAKGSIRYIVYSFLSYYFPASELKAFIKP